MRSSWFAEWILGRFTSVEKAASLVGDLEELKPQKGRLWFWRSWAMFLVVLCWRRTVAMIVASYLGMRIFEGLLFVVAGAISHQRPQEWWITTLLVFYAADAFLWTAFIFAAIRNGVRDRMTQLAFLWAGLIAAAMVSWQHPSLFLFTTGLGVVLICISIARPQNRRRAWGLAATVAGGFAILLLDAALLQISGRQGIQEHSQTSWRLVLLTLLSGWIVMSIFSRVHRWVLVAEATGGDADIA